MTRAVREALDELVAGLAARAGDQAARDILELAIVGNPIMHHLAARDRPDPARLGAVRPGHRPGGPDARPPSSALRVHPGARVYVLPCIAGHVGADTAGVILAEEPHRGRGVQLDRRRRHERRDRARQPRPAAGRLEPDRAGLRGRPDQLRASGPRPGAIERVRIDRATLEPRFRVIGCDAAGRTSPGFAEATAGARRHRASAARASSRSIAELFLAGVITADGIIDGALAARTPRDRAPTAGRSPTSSTTASPRLVDHPERRAGDPARQGRPVRRRPPADGPRRASTRSTRSAWPARSAARSTCIHAMVLGLDPRLRPRPTSRSAGNAAGTGALIALLSGARPARDRGASSGGSRRSRPRSSRASRSTSWRPWRSPTGPPRSTHLARVVDLPARPRRPRRRPRGARRERRRRRRGRRGQQGGAVMDETPRQRSGGRAGPRRRPRLHRHAERDAVPDPHARAVRGPRRGGPGAHRAQRRHDPPGGRASSSAATRTRSRLFARGRRRRRRASASASRAGCAARSSRRRAPREFTQYARNPRNNVADRRHRTRSSPRTTARRSCATSTAAGATARSRTSATS